MPMDRKGTKKLVPLARNLRREMTKEERKLWFQFLRKYPVRFYRQKVLGRYIADFYCAKAGLVVELDGSQHYEELGQEKDAARTHYLEGYDLKVLRIANNQVTENFEGVCTYIDWAVKQRIEDGGTTPQALCARPKTPCTGELENGEEPGNNPSVSYADRPKTPCTGELIRCGDDVTTPQSSAFRETAADSSPYTGELIRKEDMKTVEIYTDGACSGNPGPGGWGAILLYKGVEKELSGGERETTNNRMELTAVIQGLLALKEGCVVELWSDSKYVIDALEKGWAWGWRKKGWIKSDKNPALNPDLWAVLLDLTRQHEMHYHWVKGHAENEFNKRCDAMAVAEREKYA